MPQPPPHPPPTPLHMSFEQLLVWALPVPGLGDLIWTAAPTRRHFSVTHYKKCTIPRMLCDVSSIILVAVDFHPPPSQNYFPSHDLDTVRV